VEETGLQPHPEAGPSGSGRRPVDPEGGTRSIAFFDLDGTLVLGQTQFLIVLFLRKRNLLSLVFLLGTGLWFAAYKARLVRVTQEAREKGASILAGLSQARVADLMTQFVEEVLVPRLHPKAVAALRAHQAGGDYVVVVSAALEPVVKALSESLGVIDYIGAPCQVKDGRYTGLLDGPMPYGKEKARLALAFAERWTVNMSDCWAYADHETDLPLLRSVGHAVAVHPKSGLLEAAKRAGWPILT
jgi:HAD superfamily hydrolase (TIGR01490 family)